MARLLEEYRSNITTKLLERLKYKNINQVPRISKIVLSMGIGESGRDKSVQQEAMTHLRAITGQMAVLTKAKSSIAGFKLREGMIIGAKVTLHGERMYEFFDRLVNSAIPRIRDFRGLSPTLDGRGNYNLGVDDIIIFPEVNVDKVKSVTGLNVTIVTNAKTDEEGYELLSAMGMPFKKK